MATQSQRCNGLSLASDRDVAACHASHDTVLCAVCSVQLFSFTPMQEQKYKEGCSLIEVASLSVAKARPQEFEADTMQHRIAIQC